MFSSRLPPELGPNTLSQALRRARASGACILDLTETNPTAVGLPYPDDIAGAMADPRSLRYRPDPLGTEEAREAVAAAYACSGPAVSPAQVVLASSTSEAYAWLFKVLCDPGAEVLVPQPSYPLFDLLTRLEGVRAVPYRLDPSDAWSIDRAGLERGLTPASRAVLVVSPNNPTGSMLRSADRDWLVALAARRGIALIADEVFGDYRWMPRSDAVSLLAETRALTFTLGGLSKSAGLPQMKLAWIVVSGPEALAAEAIARLEIVADTYLSVATPVQMAAARLIRSGLDVRRQIAARVRQNLDCLRSSVRSHPFLTWHEPEGGWSAVLRIPAIEPEEHVVLRLLNDAQVLVHPGYFFDFAEEAFLVLSLLPAPDVFKEGVSRVASVVSGARS